MSNDPIDLAYVLEKAGELRVLGFNQAWAEECEKEGVWPGPVSAHQYKRAAQRIEALIGRARRQMDRAKEGE